MKKTIMDRIMIGAVVAVVELMMAGVWFLAELGASTLIGYDFWGAMNRVLASPFLLTIEIVGLIGIMVYTTEVAYRYINVKT